jgi:putative oxidoreductase
VKKAPVKRDARGGEQRKRRERGFRVGTARDVGLLMLRMAFAASCFSHGAQKPFGWFGGRGLEETGEMTGTEDFEPAEPKARLAGVLEAGGGVLLALGLATGPVAAALAGNMIVSSAVRVRNGLHNAEDGYELPLTYALVGTTIALTGPGRFSLDHLTGGALNRPWMRALALIGALVSAAYLIVARSPVGPEREDGED